MTYVHINKIYVPVKDYLSRLKSRFIIEIVLTNTNEYDMGWVLKIFILVTQ